MAAKSGSSNAAKYTARRFPADPDSIVRAVGILILVVWNVLTASWIYNEPTTITVPMFLLKWMPLLLTISIVISAILVYILAILYMMARIMGVIFSEYMKNRDHTGERHAMYWVGGMMATLAIWIVAVAVY